MKVNWDDETPNVWKNKIHVPNHQTNGKLDVGDERLFFLFFSVLHMVLGLRIVFTCMAVKSISGLWSGNVHELTT